MFQLHSQFEPTGDQPQAIRKLVKGIKQGAKHLVLLGVTGSGKTFTLANVISKIKKPTLCISHNKTLAAQTYQEFKEFFPENRIHYFVSYYDYYQPEAYIPQTDTYIEKDAKINQKIDQLRHSAVQDVLSRKDVIVVASVSCIYNLGSPERYQRVALTVKQGQKIKRNDLLRHLVALQYQRNDIDFQPGTFRVRGDAVEIYLVTGEQVLRIEFFGDEIERLLKFNCSHSDRAGKLACPASPAGGRQGRNPEESARNMGFFGSPDSPQNDSLSGTNISNYRLFPAQFWMAPEKKLDIALENIKTELREQLSQLKKAGKHLEAQRLEQRTQYDLEMIKQTGYCHGIENYSRHLEFREPGAPPFTLLDYLRDDFLCLIDESHITVPQLHAMYNTDQARKKILIEHGFRLPSALDNRPLSFEEFEKKVSQVIYSSATPGPYERKKAGKKYMVEQLVRPTGLLEPSIEIRPTKNQVQDLIKEIKKTKKKGQRALTITLTKRLAEALAEHLKEQGLRTQYLHSEIKTLERPEILMNLRKGKFDVLVGINLLREGLDLPEVALIGILDADKEGFLRNKTTLIQVMGRAARHPEGRAILYADKITQSIRQAKKEIERRRKIQQEYNEKHNVTPKAIKKQIRQWPFLVKGESAQIGAEFAKVKDVKLLEKEMKKAAQELNFERAAKLRDLIKEIKNGKKK